MSCVVIIGGGISGLSTAHAINLRAIREGLEVDTVVLEKSERTGGKIRSIQEDGYLCEWGPNGFLDSKPMTLELCDQLKIRADLEGSNDNARKRFIFTGGQLHKLPDGPSSFLTSGLLSWRGKLRIALELLISAKRDGADETLAAFARRRLGPEALEKLIGPMVSGIFAGNPETMSLRSCFPRMVELERDYGGLIRAMLSLARQRKRERREGKKVASAAGPGGTLTSFVSGIQTLTDHLTDSLQGQVRTGARVLSIHSLSEGYTLELENGAHLEASAVVSAAPAYAAAEMVAPLKGGMVDVLQMIPYAPMNIICFGYEREQIAHSLDGFGYLIPKTEHTSTLGTLWDSSIFPKRAPEGHVLLRSMMGGATNPDAADWTDQDVQQKTMGDLKQIMGIDAVPSFVRIFRHPRAIPQYTVGHSERLEALEEGLNLHPGLFLTGNAFQGVGINDCVHASNGTADKVIAFLKKT